MDERQRIEAQLSSSNTKTITVDLFMLRDQTGISMRAISKLSGLPLSVVQKIMKSGTTDKEKAASIVQAVKSATQ